MKLFCCQWSHSVNALFSLEVHGALSKCSTFAMSIFYSPVTAVQPGSSELALCPAHSTALSLLPARCYFSHRIFRPGIIWTCVKYSFTHYVFLIFSIFVLNPVSQCLPKYVVHAKHGVVTSSGLCVLCTVLSEKGSAIGWRQSMSDMPLYNMKPMYTRPSLKEDFTEIPIFISCFKHFSLKFLLVFWESVDEILLTQGKSSATRLFSA